MEPDFVTFKIEDDPIDYKLAFSFNEVAEAESIAGVNLMSALGGGSITATQTRGLLYACLKTGHPKVLLSEAGDLLTRDMSGVLKALGTTLNLAREDDEAEAAPESGDHSDTEQKAA